MIVLPHKKTKFFSFLPFIKRHRAPIMAGGLLVSLWVLSLVAISETWRLEVPAVHLIHMNFPVHSVTGKDMTVDPAIIPATWIKLSKHDGIPVVSHKRVAARSGIVKRSGVQLTKNQAGFVSKLGQYLKSMGEYAIVTSGARSPDHQLSIIKEKIRAVGASRKFPQLRRASVSKSSTWLAAWEYLRARHVPVNAPTSAGGEASASNHIKGLAVDLISGSLDHLRSLILGFAHSNFASRAPLAVASIAREPGCVHINLTPKG